MTMVYMFPGQGSQEKGMGDGLFERYREMVADADRELGFSLRELCLQDPEGRLNQTEYTQPALYAVEAMAYHAALDDGEPEPAFVLGHSLGEYAALYAAGAFDFLTGLRLVRTRGEIMSRASGGGMAAVVGLDPEKVAAVCEEAGLDGIDVANHNGPMQTVISGPRGDIEAAEKAFTDGGARRYIVLNVSGAFHSRYMRTAQEEFAAAVAGVTFQPLRRTVIANYTARPYDQAHIAEYLIAQMAHPVRWTDSIRYLLEQPEPEFREIGPKLVLTGILRKIR